MGGGQGSLCCRAGWRWKVNNQIGDRGPLMDSDRTSIFPVSLMRPLCGAYETKHMKATNCEMLDKYQVCVPCLHLFSFLFSLFTNSKTLFSAAGLFLKMRPPVLLTHPHLPCCCSSFSLFMLFHLPRKHSQPYLVPYQQLCILWDSF